MVYCWAWWPVPVAPALRRLKLEDDSWATELVLDHSGLQSRVLLPICFIVLAIYKFKLPLICLLIGVMIRVW